MPSRNKVLAFFQHCIFFVQEVMRKASKQHRKAIHPPTHRAAMELARFIRSDGTIAVPITLQLFPVELMLAARAAQDRDTTIGEVLEDYFYYSPEGHGGGFLDAMQRYEGGEISKGNGKSHD